MGGTAAVSDGAEIDSATQGGTEEALRSLIALQTRLAAAFHLDQVADATLDLLQHALGASLAAFQVASSHGPPCVWGWTGAANLVWAAVHHDVTPLVWALPAGGPDLLAIPDLDDPDTPLALSEALTAEGVQAVVAQPLGAHGAPRGLLAAYWHQPRAVTEAERLMLGLVAGQVASTLARLDAEQRLSPTIGGTSEDEDPGASRGRLAAIVESSNDAIIGKDLDGIITSWNPGAERLYGYTPDEVIGRNISLLIPPDRPDELPGIMHRLRNGLRVEHFETTRRCKDGTFVEVSVSISPIRASTGKIVGAASIARDITERRKAEQERLRLLGQERAARERAERAVNRTARLQMLTEALARALTMDDVGRVVIERGLPGLGAAAGAVAMCSADGNLMEIVSSIGYPEDIVRRLDRKPLDSAIPLAIAIRTGAPVWRDAEHHADARFREFTSGAPAYATGAALPLVVDGEVIGAIGLSFHDRRMFEPDERGFMLTLAGQCALAMQRVRIFEKERASRERLDAILGGVADGVIVQRQDGSLVYANDTAARMAGFDTAAEYLHASTPESMCRLTVLDADGRPLSRDQLPSWRALSGETTPEMVIQYVREDTGEARWSRTQSRVIHGVGGETLAISIFHDITDEVRSGERLRFLAEAGARLAGSLEVQGPLDDLVDVASRTLADWAVIILTDDDGSVRQIASAHRDASKEPLIRALHEQHLKHARDATLLWRSIQTGEPMLVPEVTDAMMASTEPNPERLDLLRALGITSLLYAPLVSQGRVQGAIALFMAESRRRFGDEDRAIAVEIARRASLTLENARLYREAHDALRARDEFLSIASHELRTPVTAISGVAQLALRSKRRGTLDEARLTRALDQIVRGSQHLVTLTEDLLDVSRLQAGRFELRIERLELSAFMTDFAERYRANLSSNHRLVLRRRADHQFTILGDPARLEQVLANLLSNAVKYSPDGGPITMTMLADGPGIQVAVKDPGIGLPPGVQETIFQPFGRAPNAAQRQIQGLGLGLYICRQIVERHGGNIWAESAGDGQGTTVYIWLPLAAPEWPSAT